MVIHLLCVVAITAAIDLGLYFKETIMPQGKGTYGSKVGRPKKKKKNKK
jgi:hypothetical protein